MILLELFWSFCKIGFTSFGGMSMVPLINSEMISHGWMTSAEVMDILAVAEMTPGPNGLNCAIFAGLRVAGLSGCFSAVMGVLSPTLTLGVLAAFMMAKFKESPVFRDIMGGVHPSTLALIVTTIFSLLESSYVVNDTVSPAAVLIGILAAWLLIVKKTGIIQVICISAVLGLLLF